MDASSAIDDICFETMGSTTCEESFDPIGESSKQVEMVALKTLRQGELGINRSLPPVKPSHNDRNKIKHLVERHENAITESEQQTDKVESETDKVTEEQEPSGLEEKSQIPLEEESKIEDNQVVELPPPIVESSPSAVEIPPPVIEAPPIDTQEKVDVLPFIPISLPVNQNHLIPYTLQSIITTIIGVAGLIVGFVVPNSFAIGVIGLALLGVGVVALYRDGKQVRVNKQTTSSAV